VTLRPELSVTELATARAGSGAVEVVWRFKDCCPSAEQEAVALQLQRGVEELWNQLVAGELELERYNGLVRAAHDAITQVILVCSAAHQGALTERDVDAAWAGCSAVANRVSDVAR
jgi:hypothetical protein